MVTEWRKEVVRWVKSGVAAKREGGTITREADGFRYLWTQLDRDAGEEVVIADRRLDEEGLQAMVAEMTDAEVSSVAYRGLMGDSLDAWLRKDAQRALSLAREARALQEAEPVIAWRFAELFEALALLALGEPEAANKTLGKRDALTIWHAVAQLYGYRKDARHLGALRAVCVALREGLGFAVPYEAEAGNAAQPEGWP